MPPLAVPPANMIAVVQHVIGVASAGMRNRLVAMGFRALPCLVDRGDNYVFKVCTMVRKSAGGQPGEKIVSMLMEKDLKKQDQLLSTESS